MILRITRGSYSHSEILWGIGLAPLLFQLRGYARSYERQRRNTEGERTRPGRRRLDQG